VATGGAGSVVTLWDTATHQRLDSFFGRMAEVGTVAFSPDGRLLAATFFGTSVGTPGRILIWDTETRREITEVRLEIKRPEAIAFSPDGKWLAYVYLFSYENKGIRLPLQVGEFAKRDNHSLQLWEIQTRREGQRIELPFGGAVYSMQFSQNSTTIALGAASGLVALLDFNRPTTLLAEHADDVLSVAFSRDGRFLATGSADNTVKLWDLQSRQSIRILRGHRGSVKQVAFSPDGTRLVSASLDKTVRIWSAVPKEANVLRAEEQITAVQFHPSGRLLAIASANNTLRIVDLLRGDVRHSVTNLANAISSLAFSPDGKHLLTGDSSRSITVWQTETWRQQDDLATYSPEEGVFALRFSSNGRFAFAGEVGFVSVWDTSSWQLATNLLSPGEARLSVTAAVSPDSRLLAVAGGPFVQLYEVGSWHRNRRLRHPVDVGTLVFTADSQTLITGSHDSQVRLWDVKNDSVPSSVLGGSVGEIAALAVSPDGNTLAVADASPVIKLWNLTTRKELFTLVGHRVGVASLAFSPDSRILASGGTDATVRIWGGTPENDSTHPTRR